MAESIQSIQGRIIGQLLSNFPSIDTSDGSMTRDLMVDPQAYEAYNLGLRIDDVAILAAFVSNAASISESDMDAIGLSYGVERRQATASTGSVVFYRKAAPTEDIAIPEGTEVSTYSDDNATALSFVTTAEAVISVSGYNSLTGNYEATAPIRCETTGTSGNVPSGLIRVTSFPQVDGVINREPAISGTDTQENISYAEDIRNAITGASRNVTQGIATMIMDGSANVSEVVCVHPNTLDDEGNISQYATPPGIAKAYIRGSVISVETEMFQYAANRNTYVLGNCPVHDIQSVTATVGGVTTTLAKGKDYFLKSGTGSLYGGTTRAADSLVFNGNTLPDSNTMFSVTYLYNSLVSTVQGIVAEGQKDYIITGTVLVAEAVAEELYLTLSIRMSYDYMGQEYRETVRNGILSYIQGLPLGASLTQDDIASYIRDTYPDYVSGITLPFTVFHTDDYDGRTIALPPYRYFDLADGNLNIDFD